jgi:hypothetical protein
MRANDELRWVRSLIEALAFGRTNGVWLTVAEQARYQDLCRREAELLKETQAA